MPFLFLPTTFQCTKKENGYFYTYDCKEEDACKADNQHPTLSPNTVWSLIAQFQLYCNRHYLVSICQATFFIVSNISTLIFSYISDLKGRKNVILLVYIIAGIPLFISSFSNSFYMFLFIFILAGIGLQPYANLCIILLSESSGEKMRQLSTVCLVFTWGLGQLILVLIAYFFRTWNVLLLYFISIPLLAQTFTYIWIYESPQFLVQHKKFNETKSVIKKIGKVNQKTIEDDYILEEELKEQKKHKDASKSLTNDIGSIFENNNGQQNAETEKNFQAKKYSYIHLFKYKSLLYPTLFLSFTSFCQYLTYYGLILALPDIGSNIYITALFMDTAEILSYVASGYIVRYIKRKLSFLLCFGAWTISCLCFIFVYYIQSSVPKIIFAMISRFFVALCSVLIYVYTPERFPTAVRAIGFGFTNFIAKFGCAAAPIVILVAQSINISPLVAFGVIGILATISCFFMKETFNNTLEDEILEEKEGYNQDQQQQNQQQVVDKSQFNQEKCNKVDDWHSDATTDSKESNNQQQQQQQQQIN